jgi:hypothetical protein
VTSTATKATAWTEQAEELAEWAWQRYVVRTDVWGGYLPVRLRDQQRRREDGTSYTLGKTRTQPPKDRRGTVLLTPEILTTHFRGERPEHVVGIHTTSPECWCRFGTVEIDAHGPDGNKAEATRRAALGWYDRATALGFHPLLWDSDGSGGFHLDLLFAQPVRTANLFWWLREFVEDHAKYGLPHRPETFPKQAAVNPDPAGKGHYGNWVRLIGRHHTKDVWATVWDGSQWLDGAEAVEHVLGLTGDSPTVIPADAEIRGRARAYRRKIPNRSEGNGRDDVAYQYLAFLVRNLAMPDADALGYAEEWDAGNSPPKGRARLEEILANVHQYGQGAYGAGMNGRHQAGSPPPDPPPTATPPDRSDGLGVILADFRVRLQPRFRRGSSVYSEALGREVKPAEGCFAPDRVLVNKLVNATDAPRDGNGVPDPKRLPKFYRDWVRCAWQELLTGLPEEVETAEVIAGAEEEFRRMVAAALYDQVTLGREGEEPERRSLIDWARRFAKPGPWKQVRSYLLWCRLADDGCLSVAVRSDLFAQVRARELGVTGHRQFVALAQLYGVGAADRAGGQRVVVLAGEFLAELSHAPTD